MNRCLPLSGFALVACVSCRDPGEGKPHPVKPPETTGAQVLAPEPKVGGTKRRGPADMPIGFDRPVSAKSIGHTSVVFKVTFADGKKAAVKPDSKRGRGRFRGEVAAFRLGSALGLSNVPEARAGKLVVADLEHATTDSPSATLVRDESLADGEGQVNVAIIPWVDRLKFVPLESASWKSKWRSWLAAETPIGEVDPKLAPQISTMVVFDYLTGNWDRFSGANIGQDESDGRLLFVDNDGAFYDPVPEVSSRKQWTLVEGIDRFSKSLVTRLRAMDGKSLASTFGTLDGSQPLLRARVIEGVDARRVRLLSLIDTKVRARGEAATLVFE